MLLSSLVRHEKLCEVKEMEPTKIETSKAALFGHKIFFVKKCSVKKHFSKKN
jgi:hypothetical protein